METLDSLAARISAEHRAVCDAANAHVTHARTAGQLLIEVRQQLKHGKWLPWLRQHCPDVAPRTAQAYMQLARLSESEAQRVAPLALREAIRTIAAPKATFPLVQLTDLYQVLVTCQDEPDQAALLDRLLKEGLQCRALMS